MDGQTSNTLVMSEQEEANLQFKKQAAILALDHAQRSRGINGFNTSVADLLKDADEIYEWLIKDL